jgi:hypothetical protein
MPALAMHAEPVASPESSAPPPVTTVTEGPPPLPPRGVALLWFGMQQPLYGLRVVLREPALRRIAATPIVFLVTLCLLVALTGERDVGGRLEVFVATMVSLAAVPVVLFGRTYRRLAAAARVPLGLSPRDVARPSLMSAIGDAIRQTILVAIGLVPVYIVVELLSGWEGVGAALVGLAWLLGVLWTLHWISIEALDNAHTLAPGATEADAQKAADAVGDPWFVRLYTGPLRPFGKLMRRLSRPWRRELDVLARAPELVLGFGLGVAGMLLIPMGALVFRPASIVGAVHLLGRLDRSGTAAPGV